MERNLLNRRAFLGTAGVFASGTLLASGNPSGLCPPPAAYAMVNDPAGIQIQSSNKKLEQAFNWAVDMALLHVQTRKSGETIEAKID